MLSTAFPISSLSKLRRAQAAPAETCDFCHAGLAENHQHVFQSATQKIECVCDACAILFSGQGQKYRRVPRRVQFLPDFQLNDAQWDGLTIPIGIAFLYFSSSNDKVVALYPSPGGPIESLLRLDSWVEIVADNPVLETFEPDVEGLLVYRVHSVREHYRIPIDECFKLIGLIRLHWKGLSGGTDVWDRVSKFFTDLKQRSR
jgi:hypothetical protein